MIRRPYLAETLTFRPILATCVLMLAGVLAGCGGGKTDRSSTFVSDTQPHTLAQLKILAAHSRASTLPALGSKLTAPGGFPVRDDLVSRRQKAIVGTARDGR